MLPVVLGLVFAVLSAPAKTAEWHSGVMARETVLQAIEAPAVRDAEVRLNAAIGPAGTDWSAVEAFIADPALDSVGREYLLHGVLMRARTIESPDEAALDFVSGHLGHNSQVFVSHEEGPLPLAVYPVADAADGTLRFWHRARAKREASAAFAAGDLERLGFLRRPGSEDYAGTLAALREADTATAQAAKAWFAANAVDGDFYEAQTVVALATGDKEFTGELLVEGTGRAATQLVLALREKFDAGTAFELLVAATGNHAVSSTAVYEIDRLRITAVGRQVDSYLLAALSDPFIGATAAAALARRGDPAILDRVASALMTPFASSRHQSRAVLTLMLADSAVSRAALRKALASGSIVEGHLETEVERWLAN
jgi:hypothetical protein